MFCLNVETEMHSRITKFLDESSINFYRDKHLLGFGKKDGTSFDYLFIERCI